MKRALLIVVLAACSGSGTVKLQLEITSGSDQACPSQTCTDIPMACASVLSVRILSPDMATAPYISVCQVIQADHDKDLCSIDSVDLPSDVAIPEETLEVQVAIYPLEALSLDGSGNPICPTTIDYTASTGFPAEIAPTPAVGGRAFYHAGDSQTVVELGCTDLDALNAQSCTGAAGVAITASVEDFDTEVTVPRSIADLLSVSVGEPSPQPDMTGQGTIYVLDPANAHPLDRTVIQPDPEWGDDVDLTFVAAACLEVLEDGAEETTALTCRKVAPTATTLDLHGFRLAKSTLQSVLDAVADTTFPDAGLVVGIVLDATGSPAPNITVVPSSSGSGTLPTVQYLNSDRTAVAGTSTSTSGVFVSPDAPFATSWSTNGAGVDVGTGFGGLVEGKVTVVVLQLEPPVVGGGS